MLNPASVTEKKTSPNIFQRMTGASWSKKNSAIEQEQSSKDIVSSVESSKPLEPQNSLETTTPEGLITSQSENSTQIPLVTPTPETKDIKDGQPAKEIIAESTKTMDPGPPSAKEPPLETQPRLSGVEPKKRLAESQDEEDLLEIPAFLRRQAN